MRFFLALFIFLSATPCFASPSIVVSIAPVHSLVSHLTKGVVIPRLLLSSGSSPHSASLKPSQAKALSEADLFIWIGPELESFLTAPVSRLVKPGAEMQLLRDKSLKLLPQRHGGFWEEDPHDTHGSHSEHSVNPHIWLSPDNARRIVTGISKRLIEIDPENTANYAGNLADVLILIDQLQGELSKQLTPVHNQPYLVFHDAYPYFEEAFSLNAIGSIRVSAERPPGARRIQQIREKIAESSAVCLFSEPQFSPALTKTLAQGSGLTLGELDPLGSQKTSGDDAWFILMRKLGENLKRCLSGDKN